MSAILGMSQFTLDLVNITWEEKKNPLKNYILVLFIPPP